MYYLLIISLKIKNRKYKKYLLLALRKRNYHYDINPNRLNPYSLKTIFNNKLFLIHIMCLSSKLFLDNSRINFSITSNSINKICSSMDTISINNK